MADISIPAPDANGYWHFTYITRDTDGRWYGGKRSTKKHPLSDRYLGSGRWIQKHPARKRLKREIVAFYASSAEVFAAETLLVTWDTVFDDPMCMNKREGGAGMTVEYMTRLHADPVFRAAYETGISKRGSDQKWQDATTAANRRKAEDPEWLKQNAASNRRLAEDPEWLAKNAAKMRRLHADQDFRVAHLAGLAKRNADPTWNKNVRAGGAKRSADPNWRKNQADGTKKRNANPTWQTNVAAAARRRHAANRAAKLLAVTQGSLALGTT